jgi:NAD(P)-dependent dehydrogenase (short-subunit alcohol dehydrogenase family)
MSGKAFPHYFSLEGQVSFVTGGNRGLGRSIAIGLAEAGSDVVVMDLELTNGEAIKNEVQRLSRKCLLLQGDVSNEQDVDHHIAETVKRFGRLDILVNNAAIAGAYPLEEISISTWRKVVDVNLTGVFMCCRRTALEMRKRRSGRIINIASTFGQVGTFNGLPASAYCATKGGVVNLTRELAIELAPFNIRVNAIAPSWHDTEMNKGMLDNEELYKVIMDRTPLKRIGKPDEIKGAVVFLASDASAMVTGHILNVDGGWLSW